jgi:predicted nucleotidyltransferase
MDISLNVPTINVRDRIPQAVIEEVARRIAVQFHPLKIILFGSYAYGNPKPESDIDLLVVMDTPLREIEQARQIRQFIDPLFGLDLIVYTPQRLAQRLIWGDQFLQEITGRGKVLYASPDA